MARVPRLGGQAASGGGVGQVLLNAILADMLGKAVGSVVSPGGVTPSPIPGGTGSKYNLTAPDVVAIQRQVDEENYRREGLNAIPGGRQLPYLNAQQIIQDVVSTNRKLMEEAGARERAIAAIEAQGAVQSAMAQSLGNAIGTGLTSAGGVAGQSIATGGQRFDTQRQLEELSRAI